MFSSCLISKSHLDKFILNPVLVFPITIYLTATICVKVLFLVSEFQFLFIEFHFFDKF